jgi:hypothetical protein
MTGLKPFRASRNDFVNGWSKSEGSHSSCQVTSELIQIVFNEQDKIADVVDDAYAAYQAP